MPGAGKSTVGVLLAKALSRGFVDTDLVVQSAEGRRLQDIVDADGVDRFRAIEELHVLGLRVSNSVIATGGSVPYSERAMGHLKRDGVVVYLQLPLAAVLARITNMDSRGIAIGPGQSFEALYAERVPLYERWADLRVDCDGLGHEDVVARTCESLVRDT